MIEGRTFSGPFHWWSMKCEKCPLHLVGQSNCIPLTPIYRKPGNTRAILVVGEKPGVEEDRQGQHFVGVVGQYFRTIHLKWLQSRLGDSMPDVWGTNAVRCRSDDEPTVKQIGECHGFLDHELVELQTSYPKGVFVFALGGPACRSVTGGSLGSCLHHQGQIVEVGGSNVRMFSSFNPAVLLPGRDPSLIRSIDEHLGVLARFLRTGNLPVETRIDRLWGTPSRAPASPRDQIISLDIETYGALAGRPEQRCFHPAKSLAVDNVDRRDLVATAAAGWMEGREIRKALWVFPRDREAFVSFIHDAISKGLSFLGHNLPFDITYIREAFGLQAILDRRLMQANHCLLMDTSVASYLQNDMRTEKSLKALVTLLGIHTYNSEKSLKGGFRYDSAEDPELHFYNVTDAAVTLLAWFKLRDLTLEHEGPNTPKFGHYCLQWFSDMIWTVIEMNEAGIEYDRAKLLRIQTVKLAQAQRLLSLAERWWGETAILGGTGSMKFARSVVEQAVRDANMIGDRRVEISKKTKVVSCNQANMHLLVDNLPRTSIPRMQLRMIEDYRTTTKVVNSYTTPLLTDPVNGIAVGGRAFPTWFVTPSTEHEDSTAKGGTKQGRMTCQRPGRQTELPVIWKCTTSRFKPGVVSRHDYSQIELKMMALLSGDPVMIDEHRRGVDVHLMTGIDIIEALYNLMEVRGVDGLYGTSIGWCEEVLRDPGRVTKQWPGIGKWRQIGKTCNFARGFKATWHTIQKTIRRDMRIDLDRPFCESIGNSANKRYPIFVQWQDDLIARATREGRLVLPLIGDSRSFLGGRLAIQESYVPTICNFLVQDSAARVTQSGQRQVMDRMRERGLRTLVIENIYDAFTTDGPAEEEQEVSEIVSKELACPPFYRELQLVLGRELPLGFETKVIART